MLCACVCVCIGESLSHRCSNTYSKNVRKLINDNLICDNSSPYIHFPAMLKTSCPCYIRIFVSIIMQIMLIESSLPCKQTFVCPQDTGQEVFMLVCQTQKLSTKLHAKFCISWMEILDWRVIIWMEKIGTEYPINL